MALSLEELEPLWLWLWLALPLTVREGVLEVLSLPLEEGVIVPVALLLGEIEMLRVSLEL